MGVRDEEVGREGDGGRNWPRCSRMLIKCYNIIQFMVALGEHIFNLLLNRDAIKEVGKGMELWVIQFRTVQSSQIYQGFRD